MIMNFSFYVPLPKLTKEHYRVCFYKTRDIHLAENVEMINFVRLVVNIQEIRMIEDVTYGDMFVFDGKDVTLRFMLKATPMILYKMLTVIYKVKCLDYTFLFCSFCCSKFSQID